MLRFAINRWYVQGDRTGTRLEQFRASQRTVKGLAVTVVEGDYAFWELKCGTRSKGIRGWKLGTRSAQLSPWPRGANVQTKANPQGRGAANGGEAQARTLPALFCFGQESVN